MLKPITAAILTTLTAVSIAALPSHAQTRETTIERTTTTETQVDPTALYDLNRAKNLARQAAERENGGLGNYRAESSMHGPASQSPFVDNGNGSWTFTFKGRRPYSDAPSIESVVTVSQDGRVNIDYNGAIRSTAR
ncbi:MAG TPA: hypothetical protein DCE56_06505 [Cyanobacteria bacterium UBA8553]|nr:hypothetical protein [Cyanobacteria bacterium UBA8553]